MSPRLKHRTRKPRAAYRCLDLFSGCGGLSLGLSWARNSGSRIETVAALDSWDAACLTYGMNLEVQPLISGVTLRNVGNALTEFGDVEIVVGGPPCQGFSTSGRRALEDRRNHLVKTFLDAVELASPRAFIMENVSGFTTFQNGMLLREASERAQELGFRVATAIVLASRFGVPQRRRRFIMVGVKGEAFVFPNCLEADQSDNPYLDFDQRIDDKFSPVTFDQATNDLPRLMPGQQSSQYASQPRSRYQSWARAKSEILYDHVAPSHNARLVSLMSYIPQGSSAFDPEVSRRIPPSLRPTSGFANSYSRIRGSQPSPTITRNFTTPSSANCIHPRQNRALSLREGARCQSFPDVFRFHGSHSEKRLQIGNAVPPLLGRALGASLLESLNQ
jgi:DNA (cytosine-5)-methyltransferase 1